ncbi:PREDICTED: sphingolipid delta(4)-desaturase DES1-like isoform X2 [Branchiostoma belcheri]|uniref:sphingolipid 4-desaturase n=1 Tax=Branchiostoma belcheri TaxID=7741 RepID=A0A6P4ZMY2_BRABE|nr:PREDICTED: sphingolipid delta(4)-desaturase DES1-like isoform X1 [Branchiostoma belcheri]XP_019630981.1 PREDICTED: sphingolipid delta(4)-desaturase DES1-like isoform X2 [Branchiostoma belcheri]
MGGHVSRTDFEWVYTDEPHATRRKEIMAKYPQVKKLMGHDPNLKYWVFIMVAVQLTIAYLLKDSSWPLILLTAYFIGGTINHIMLVAWHEICHNLAFGHARPRANKALGIFGNVIIGFPASISFKKYHLEHHKFQAQDGFDPDLPTVFEGQFFCNSLGKALWVFLLPAFYSLRPLVVRPKPITDYEVINLVLVGIADVLIVYFMSYKSLFYLAIGTLLGLGLHPMAAHFIAEHYMFIKGQETYSYYGPMNAITFNLGYHMEHHDFPNIPGCNLPKLKEIAKEYYEPLPSHSSWPKVIWDFITDPAIGPYCRMKRRSNRARDNGSCDDDPDKDM